MKNNYNPQDELREIEEDISIMKKQITQHLSKFQDLDSLFENAKLIIQKYFEEQDEYKDINIFTQYLKEEIIFYVNSFKLKRKERKNINDKLDYIEEKYNELIYFWEFNPVKARLDALEQEEKEQLSPKTNEIVSYVKILIEKIIKHN